MTPLYFFTLSTFSQPINGVDYKNRDSVSYRQPIQIDSSDYFIIAKQIAKSDRAKYNTNLDYFGNPSYWAEEFYCEDIIIYNRKTHDSKNLFKIKPSLVLAISDYSSYGGMNISAILKKHLLFLAKTYDHNKDGILDHSDPLYLFLATKSGDSLTQISPNGYNVITWTLSKDKKNILVKMVKDTNGNNKYSDEPEIFYQIDLHDDISKIKCYPINIIH